ncbi:MAG: type II toxin-antitoxin system HicA family toxin [Parafilimonas sp.]
MGNFRPLNTDCWEKFLSLKGFQLSRVKGSHFQWKRAGYRTIPVWHDEKQIPPAHLKTGCFTLGITMQDLYAWAEENC